MLLLASRLEHGVGTGMEDEVGESGLGLEEAAAQSLGLVLAWNYSCRSCRAGGQVWLQD